MLPAGSPSPWASEQLGSAQMSRLLEQLAERFDFVVVDTAPLLPTSGPLAVVGQVPGVVALARLNQTPRDAVRRMMRIGERRGRHTSSASSPPMRGPNAIAMRALRAPPPGGPGLRPASRRRRGSRALSGPDRREAELLKLRPVEALGHRVARERRRADGARRTPRGADDPRVHRRGTPKPGSCTSAAPVA